MDYNDEYPELIIPESLKWIEPYLEESKLSYRIPSYKIARIVRMAYELEKAEAKIVELESRTT